MMITYQSEDWNTYFHDPELPKLWNEHFAEFEPVHQSKLAFGPDVAGYVVLATSGQLEIVVARKDGKMIGYCLFIVRRHLHYNALCAFEDAYFVTSSERGSGVGRGLIEKSIEVMKKRGTIKAYWMTKEFKSIARLFESLGMERSDTVYSQWLSEA